MANTRRSVSESTYDRVMRVGITSEIAGVLVLSAIIFTKVPVLLTLCMSAGALLIVVGFMTWLWSVVWGR